jgi:tetratricopeptide (TPR) repeat protein
MNIKENNRREIEVRLKEMGDFVKMDYLNLCLNVDLDIDARRFVLLKLSELYEKKSMFLEAGKMLQNAAPINPSASKKINDYLGAAGFFVKAGNFDGADSAFGKALVFGGPSQNEEIKKKRNELYRLQLDMLLIKDKRQNALTVCEKILKFELPEAEKKIIQGKLLDLYDKLGKIREYYALKKLM